jgi:pilus assembly protein CpaB
MFRILVLVGALAAGGVAAWLSFSLQPGQAPAATVVALEPQIRTQEVLVAALDLAPGVTLTDQELRWQSWPEEALNPGFISHSGRPDAVADLTGSVVRQAMVAGEPIREGKLANKGSGYLAAILPSGMRAVAVRVSAESAAGGFILPNDRVDIIYTGGSGGALSRTLLTNIKVLAIDQNAVDSETIADTAVGKTATLELDRVQAEVIAAAQASGSLSLALRATADNQETPTLVSQRDDEASEPAPPASRRGTVRIIRAGKSQTVQSNGPVQ